MVTTIMKQEQGKMCVTHFSHQQTSVNAYISEGSGGRKVSTAKQLVCCSGSKADKKYDCVALKAGFQGSILYINSQDHFRDCWLLCL